MTEQEMIRHLHSAIEHAAPDAVGDVLPLRCAERNGGYDTTGTPGKKPQDAPHGAVAGCRVPCADNRRGGMQYTQSHLVRSIISVDVKPQCGIEAKR